MSAGGSLGAPKDAPPAGSQGELLHVCLQSSKIQRPQGLLERCERVLLLLLLAGTSSGAVLFMADSKRVRTKGEVPCSVMRVPDTS